MTKITLNAAEVAELIGVSVNTIYLMARENEIPCRKVRGRIIFHKETIENWIATPLQTVSAK